MICPPPFLIKLDNTAFVTYNNPLTFVSIIVSQSSKLASSNKSLPRASPALFTRISRPSSIGLSCKISNTFFLCWTSNTSTVTGILYVETSSSFRSFNNFSLRPVIIISCPDDANFAAIALPKPELAPVMRIFFMQLNSNERY